MTTYQGKEACESEWITEEGSMSQYFNEDGTFAITVIKDKTGKVIQELNYNVPK